MVPASSVSRVKSVGKPPHVLSRIMEPPADGAEQRAVRGVARRLEFTQLFEVLLVDRLVVEGGELDGLEDAGRPLVEDTANLCMRK
jgi:hypothetical protein